MIYRRFGKTGWQVSAVGQGCWNIGNQWGEMSGEAAAGVLRTAYEQGINLFDVAESYGNPNGLSEIRLGRALRAMDREKLFLVSKTGNWGKRSGQGVPRNTPDMIRLCGHACCGRLGIERLDVLLCHEGDITDPGVYIDGFRQLRSEGFIREYGISTNNPEVLRRFQEVSGGEGAVVELDYSLLNRAPEKDLLPYCREQDLAVLVRGPLARGLLSGRFDEQTVFADEVRGGWNEGGPQRADYLAKIARVRQLKERSGGDLVTAALRFALSHPAGPVAIPGATRPEQVITNAAAGAATMDEAAIARLIA